ncbi:MAG: hypothetical protein FJX74_23160, partial [Armatimonadetes bacterium]|nr:hypothetical protein [Armatimonadota bacterium]
MTKTEPGLAGRPTVRWAVLLGVMAVGTLGRNGWSQDAPAEDASYRIKAGDTLEIVADVGRTPFVAPVRVQVCPDGRFSYPEAGDVPAAGRTRLEIADTIRQSLLRVYRQVTVAVNVSGFRDRKVFVWGEVLRPGPLPITTESIPLAQAIAGTGGYKPTAAGGVLYRAGLPGQQLTVEELGSSLDLLLQPDDVVMVAATEPLTIVGEVRSPVSVSLPSGARVLDALAAVGNFTPDADLMSVLLIDRQNQVRRINLKQILTDPEPEDNPLVAGYQFLVIPPRAATAVAGEVTRPGVYVSSADAMVSTLIAQAGGLTLYAGSKATAVDETGNIVEVDLQAAMSAPGSSADLLVKDLRSLIVPRERREVVVFGEVLRAGAFQPDHLPITLSAAIAQAGGLGKDADPHSVSLYRADGTFETLDIDPPAGAGSPERVAVLSRPLGDGDVVVVGRRQARVTVLGAVEAPGVYTFSE